MFQIKIGCRKSTKTLLETSAVSLIKSDFKNWGIKFILKCQKLFIRYKHMVRMYPSVLIIHYIVICCAQCGNTRQETAICLPYWIAVLCTNTVLLPAHEWFSCNLWHSLRCTHWVITREMDHGSIWTWGWNVSNYVHGTFKV